jgi:hypothetical protein
MKGVDTSKAIFESPTPRKYARESRRKLLKVAIPVRNSVAPTLHPDKKPPFGEDWTVNWRAIFLATVLIGS